MNSTLSVLKFGGSSLSNANSLAQVIGAIKHYRTAGPVAVVVSAMGGTTDNLLEALNAAQQGDFRRADKLVDTIGDLASRSAVRVLGQLLDEKEHKIATSELTRETGEFLEPLRRLLYGVSLLKESTPQTQDLSLSFGERLSARIVSKLLRASGEASLCVDARQWLVTDNHFGAANVNWIETSGRLPEKMASWSDKITVHTGFIGQSPDGKTTTLGRNGSDYTATLLARGIGADKVIISTDTTGVMTADPLLVKDSYPIPNLSYSEALELANFGARMFHAKTMIPLIEADVPLFIKSTSQPEKQGTQIDALGSTSAQHPTSITSLEEQALIDVGWRSLNQQARLGSLVLDVLSQENITVWLATEAAHGQAISVVVPRSQLTQATEAIKRALAIPIQKGEVEPIRERSPVTLVTLVAEAMGRTPNVAGRLFQTLGGLGVMVRAIGQGASARSISCVVDAADTAVTVRSAHAAFNLAHQEVNLLILGHGVVGSELIRQLKEHKDTLESTHNVRVKIAGVATSQRALFNTEGISLDSFEEEWSSAQTIDEARHLDLLQAINRLPVPIVVDCTSGNAMIPLYQSALEQGIHVVAANKKPLSAELSQYDRLMETARKHHRDYHFETTVGAGLPVIETLKNLVRTGDRVVRIEGSFSGSLGYITRELMAGIPLSKAVATAREKGFTEPLPQDDLGGLDVARKALILARELGIRCELEDLQVNPYVPQSALKITELDKFIVHLEQHDVAYAQRVQEAAQKGHCLAYLATINTTDESITVGLSDVSQNHPAARLRGAESFVAFYTERYGDQPLVVQGAGAGAAVTAAGVLADIFKVSQSVRGR